MAWRSANRPAAMANDSPSRPARTTRVIFLSSSTTSSLTSGTRSRTTTTPTATSTERRRVAPRRHDRAVVVARDAVAVLVAVDAVVAAVTGVATAEVVRRISLAGRVSQTGPSPGVSCATDILAPGRHNIACRLMRMMMSSFSTRTRRRCERDDRGDRIVAASTFRAAQIQTACCARSAKSRLSMPYWDAQRECLRMVPSVQAHSNACWLLLLHLVCVNAMYDAL